MKDVSSIETLNVPEGVTVQIKARTISVEGPRGKLVKNVGHIQMDIQLVSLGEVWFRVTAM
jgi:large subunit ribosomal protein L9e